MRKLSRIVGLVSALSALTSVTWSCAGSPTTRPNTSATTRMDTMEFRRPEFRTVYDAIRALRPDWLLARGGPTSLRNPARQAPTVGVFFEGESRGYSLDKLSDLVGGDVRSLRRISPSESLATYGPDWPWGGIVITRA